jgi:antitoxin CptB
MSGTTLSTDGMDVRRRKLLYRAWHRGMQEMDLIMGRFADSTILGLDDTELTAFEVLIDIPDRELLGWITGEIPVPADQDSALLRRMRAFHVTDGGR